jgi:hypothetical protein
MSLSSGVTECYISHSILLQAMNTNTHMHTGSQLYVASRQFSSQKRTLASIAYSYIRTHAVTRHLLTITTCRVSESAPYSLAIYAVTVLSAPMRRGSRLPIRNFPEPTCMLLLRPIGPCVDADVP